MVTGRKRRCGWFDACLVRQVVKVSGIDGIALTKLDVLDGFEEIKVCVGYTLDGERIDSLPAGTQRAGAREAHLRELEGWTQSTRGARTLGRAAGAGRQIRAPDRGADRVPGDAAVDQPRARRHHPDAAIRSRIDGSSALGRVSLLPAGDAQDGRNGGRSAVALSPREACAGQPVANRAAATAGWAMRPLWTFSPLSRCGSAFMAASMPVSASASTKAASHCSGRTSRCAPLRPACWRRSSATPLHHEGRVGMRRGARGLEQPPWSIATSTITGRLHVLGAVARDAARCRGPGHQHRADHEIGLAARAPRSLARGEHGVDGCAERWSMA